MTHPAVILRRVKQAARDKYAWPGGYPLYILMGDCETICPDCARKEFKNIARATINPDYGRDWQALGVDAHYEGEPLVCAHCGTETPSAYGEDSDND